MGKHQGKQIELIRHFNKFEHIISYAFKFDEVAARTSRDESPGTTPEKGIKHADAESNSSSSSSFSSGAQFPMELVQRSRQSSRSKGPKSGK